MIRVKSVGRNLIFVKCECGCEALLDVKFRKVSQISEAEFDRQCNEYKKGVKK